MSLPNTVIVVNPKTSRVELMATFRTREDAQNLIDHQDSDSVYITDGRYWYDYSGDLKSLELVERGGWNYITFPYEDRHTERLMEEDTSDFWNYRLRDRTHIPEQTEPLETMKLTSKTGLRLRSRRRKN